jgi:hypothetical protein
VTDHARDDPVEVLRRWEDFGAVWQVVARTPEQVTVSLRRCDAGEEVSRLVSDDPALRAYVDAREPPTTSDAG